MNAFEEYTFLWFLQRAMSFFVLIIRIRHLNLARDKSGKKHVHINNYLIRIFEYICHICIGWLNYYTSARWACRFYYTFENQKPDVV